jgi:hypothetical protein
MFGPGAPTAPYVFLFPYICPSQSCTAKSSSAGSPETPVTSCQTTRRHMPYKSYVCLHIYRRDNLQKSNTSGAESERASQCACCSPQNTDSVRGKGTKSLSWARSLQGTDRDGAPVTKNDVCGGGVQWAPPPALKPGVGAGNSLCARRTFNNTPQEPQPPPPLYTSPVHEGGFALQIHGIWRVAPSIPKNTFLFVFYQGY